MDAPSLWQAERLPYPVQALPATADVVVVGAGIIGVSVALALAEAGRRPVVVDREGVAAGASGRNGGLLLPGTAELYPDLVARWTRPHARELWAAAERGARGLVAWMEGRGLDCAWRPEGGLHVAVTPAEAEALGRAQVMLVDDGFDATWLEPDQLSGWCDAIAPAAFHGALLLPGGGPLHSGQLVTALAREAARAGAQFVDGVAARALAVATDGVTVETDRGPVWADAVVVATNAWAGRLVPALAPAITPVRGQVLSSAPAGPRRLAGAWSANEGFEYLQQLPDGRVVLGGMRWAAPDLEVGHDVPDVNPDLHRRLEAWFAAAFPGFGPLAVERRWAGIMDFTPDRLPVIGPLGPRTWVAAGLNGHGLPFATLSAEIIGADLTDRVPSPAATAFAPGRLTSIAADAPAGD